MLGKILKYEFKATARVFLLLFAALIVVAALNAALISLGESAYSSFDNNVLRSIYSTITLLAVFLYVLMTIAVFVVTFVIIVVRFYRMLGNEGYLWFTLPVSANQHILGKLIPALVWSLASMVVFIISLGVLMLPLGWFEELWRLPEYWSTIMSLGLHPSIWIICSAIVFILAILQGYLMFYASIAIGPSIVRSRLGGSVLAYLFLYIITQIVATVQLVSLVIPMNNQASIIENALTWGNVTSIIAAAEQLLVIGTIWYAIGAVILTGAFYLLTRFFMTRKLNLA